MVLPFKDSEGGTWSYSVLIGVTSASTRQRKSKRSMLIAPRHLPLIKISVPPLARPLTLTPLRHVQRYQTAEYPSLVWGAASLGIESVLLLSERI